MSPLCLLLYMIAYSPADFGSLGKTSCHLLYTMTPRLHGYFVVVVHQEGFHLPPLSSLIRLKGPGVGNEIRN